MAEKTTGGNLDWAEAYAHLERLSRAMESQSSTPEESLAVLDSRARELARPLTADKTTGPLLEVARFRAGGQLYALASHFLLEVLRHVELTLLPGAPAVLRGLTLLRGEVLPLVDLAPLFGRPATRAGDVVLVVGASRPEFGVCVEEVEEVLPLPREALLPPPAALDAGAGGLVSGIDREGLILLEGEVLLSDSRLVFDISDEGFP